MEHVFSTYSHTSKWVRSNGCLSLVVAQASAICFNCLHRSPNCLLSLLIMCAAVSEEAAASDILVGAQPRTMCWTRARSLSSELVDTATARGASEWRTPRVWDCSSHFAQNDEAEEHRASP